MKHPILLRCDFNETTDIAHSSKNVHGNVQVKCQNRVGALFFDTILNVCGWKKYMRNKQGYQMDSKCESEKSLKWKTNRKKTKKKGIWQ